jgi:Ca2+-binding RTX toxin-like protein
VNRTGAVEEQLVTFIGTNLAAVNYYSTEEPFIDRFHTASTWIAKDAAGTNISSTLTLDSRGDPTNLSGVTSLAVSIEVDPIAAPTTDQYVLTYSGTAGKISIANATIVSQTAGKVVFNYTGTDDNPYAHVTFSGLNGSDPLSNVHMVRADQVDLYNSGELFNPDFIAKVSQWGVARFMDWGDTNNSDTVSWGTRTALTDGSWSGASTTDGVPLEAMVKLANEAHVDMWYNVPTKADNTYVTNALTYIRDHLDPTLKVHVEWSNEVWNAGFVANSYAQNQANALWGNGSTVSHGANIYYGYRSAQIANIAHQVFTGTHAGQVVDVLGGLAANSGLLTFMLDGVAKAGLGSASALFDEYAVAPYFGAEMGTGVKDADLQTVLNWAKSGSTGLDAAFHELEYGGSLTGNQSLAVIAQWLSASGTAAHSAGLDLVAYEGGISLSTTRWAAADKPTVQNFFERLLEDPRMGNLYTKLVNDFKAAGGTEFLPYNDAGAHNDSGSWGMLTSIYDEGSPRYDAMKAMLSSSADAPTTATGTAGADILTASSSGGLISALGGNDKLTAGAANDTLDGGDGNDQIIGSSSTKNAAGALIEGDLYMGGAGSDTISGGIGNDHIYGNKATAVAGSVDGADSLSASAGNDYVQGNAGADTIDGGTGNDRLYGGADGDNIIGNLGHDYLQGNKGNDVLSGGDGNDTIHGGADNDTLNGDAGNDQLYGDAGYDRMTGGAGSDNFIITVHSSAYVAGGPTDEITDFTDGIDKIGLGFHPTLIVQGTATSLTIAGDVAAQLLSSHVGAADVAAVSVGSDTYLFYDSAGHGGALDSAIKLDAIQPAALTPADFL